MPKAFLKARDPVSSYTHFIGAILSAAGMLFILFQAVIDPYSTPAGVIGGLIFGCSLIALYLASSHYHFFTGDERHLQQLRKLDHSMIYVLIAGTYTPICLHYFEPVKGIIFTVGMWVAACFGIVLKLCFLNVPRWLYTVMYIGMGWVIILDPGALLRLEAGSLALLLTGGVSYTVGAVCYILKKPNLSPKYGFHEVFHLFVMAGSFFHYLMIAIYIC
ncbi:MAG: hemolysin III family protein [Ruminococcaceae bacterium]|nr:hemolysin III family protein [Oscillospiraceae bacterium]